MKKLLLLCGLFFSLFSFGTMQAEIIEIEKMEEILSSIEEGTLVVLDLDNTVMETKQLLGSDQWFSHEVGSRIAAGDDPFEAVNKTLPDYVRAQNSTEMRPVEEETPALIHMLQERKVKVVGLTARSTPLIERTLYQLSTIDVDFSVTPPAKIAFFWEGANDRIIYRNGVIFNGNNDKGETFLSFVEKVGATPQKVLFVDDKLKHVKALEKAVERGGIPFVGFRYGGADARVKNFDKKIADLQLHYIKNLISDEVAEALLKKEETEKVFAS